MKHILLFATFLLLAGTACKKSKKELMPPDFLTGKWVDASMSLAPQAAYTFSSDRNYTWFPGGTAPEETGTYQLRTTTSPKVFELRLTKTGTQTPSFELLYKDSNTFIRTTVGGKIRILMRM